MLPHRVRYKLHQAWEAIRPWFYATAGIVSLITLWYVLANLGPGQAVTAVPEPAQASDPAIVKLSEELAELEKQYQVYASANIISDEALGVLLQAVDKQRLLVRSSLKGDYTAQTALEKLEAELDTLKAKRTVGQIEALVKEAEAAQEQMRLKEAKDAFTEALRLQREINSGTAGSRYKNILRETTLTGSIVSLEALPIHQEKEAALAKARAAMTDERWADALTAYISARDAQGLINREYRNTRYANLSEFDRLEGEIASLNAAGIAKAIDEKEKYGDDYARAGDHVVAGKAFAEALALQQQINDRFSRSRFVSSTRIEALEVKLQTARSQSLARELAKLDQELSDDLRKRRVVAAEQKLPRAVTLTKRLESDFPRSRSVDGALRIKLNYLVLKGAELRKLQDEVYERMLPMVGVSDRLMLGSETSQGLYQMVMNTNPSRNPGRALPVDSVNIPDVEEFCQRLGWVLGTPVRLPTADEYRIAWGAGGGDIRSSADGSRVSATDSGKGNVNGYRDLVGNLAEWVQPEGAGDRANIIGGSYLDTPEVLSKFPVESRPRTDRARHIGFRFVVMLPADRER